MMFTEWQICSAAENGDLARLRAILTENPKLVSGRSVDGYTPLHLAAQNGHIDTVRLLLGYHADVNAYHVTRCHDGSPYETPLCRAAENSHTEIVRLLLENDAEVDAQPSGVHGCRPIDYASYPNRKVTYKILERYVGPRNSRSFSEIHFAARNGDLDTVRRLIEIDHCAAGKEDIDKVTPLHLAAIKGHTDVMTFLIESQADVNAKTSRGIEATPLHWAAANAQVGAVKLLLAFQADVNARECCKETPLHQAALRGHIDVAKVLLACNADVNSKERYGSTPLHYAVDESNLEMVALLISNHAEVNIKSEFNPVPLSMAVEQGNEAMVALLLANHAESDRMTSYYAIKSGHKGVGDLLRLHGIGSD